MKDMRLTKKDLEDYAVSQKLKLDFCDLEKITDKWGFIRQAYVEKMPDIMKVSKDDVRRGISPYFIDWVPVFTPIEQEAWNSIRSTGGIAMYPQFPLFNYFIDFANPYLRIGLEMDGKDFHDQNKDKLRDQKLADYGWKIFRVSGKECYVEYKLPYELDQD
ncbi:MAG: DUF559 domain-containing protein, partial [Tunicatimonas sp.]